MTHLNSNYDIHPQSFFLHQLSVIMHVVIQNRKFKSSLRYSFCLSLTISESTQFFHLHLTYFVSMFLYPTSVSLPELSLCEHLFLITTLCYSNTRSFYICHPMSFFHVLLSSLLDTFFKCLLIYVTNLHVCVYMSSVSVRHI